VEPCEALAEATPFPVWSGYWDSSAMEDVISRGKFDLITAFNVLAHTEWPFDFLVRAKEALAPGGQIWVQTSQAGMVTDGTFDAIYHEHVSYFTPRSIVALARRAGPCWSA
jgi:2-polyprenyl-3-methyl-5-hydroxy-6-metoxy-1,4-benzoquinol methylase